MLNISKKIIGLIIGVPIVCCGILMYYVRYTQGKETAKFTDGLTAGTFAILQCIDELRDHLTKGDNNADQ